jgi:cell division protein FtsW (lipid II flippase)
MILQKHFNIDWILFFAVLPLMIGGLITMKTFGFRTEGDYFFLKQIIWIAVAFVVFFAFSFIDWRFLRKGGILMLFLGLRRLF